MLGALLVLLAALRSTSLHQYADDVYYDLPRFWTNVGFCPMGNINHKDMTAALLSAEVQQNLRYIAALPEGAVTHVRVHWLLELLEFVQYSQDGQPIYNFKSLDEFLMNLDEMGSVYPVIEFMGNPGDVFQRNPTRNAYFWENLSYQVTRRYLNMFGATKLLRWRFESWNEPDLEHYNVLNFTVTDYMAYLKAIRSGLIAAGQRKVHSLNFPLRGPAGLFKSVDRHPLCWMALKYCNDDIQSCPIEILTYHRKGNGLAGEVLESSTVLLKEIYQQYPALKNLQISNDEADPIAGWSTPQEFHGDVRYAAKLISIVFDHWSALLERNEFKNLESISHDNAFLSYHPYEFSQRTLLAHFRMNETTPPHSQFILKPVYAAMAMLSKLLPAATNVQIIESDSGEQIRLLKTMTPDNKSLQLSWLALPPENATGSSNSKLKLNLPVQLNDLTVLAYIIEVLEQQRTDPAYVWQELCNSSPYPNASSREVMRRSQTPLLYATGILDENRLTIDVAPWKLPWIILMRVCDNSKTKLKPPQQLTISAVTYGEVLVTWHELANSANCLKTYEVWFRCNDTATWNSVSKGWHVPYPSYQYAPADGKVNGFYKVRGIDVFDSRSAFSESVEYIEL